MDLASVTILSYLSIFIDLSFSVEPGPLHLADLISSETDIQISIERPEMLHCYSALLAFDYKVLYREESSLVVMVRFDFLIFHLLIFNY